MWPLSRKSYLKQFSKLMGETSLSQQTVRLVCGEGYAAPLFVTAEGHGEGFSFHGDGAAGLEIAARATLIEPQARNTAPAVLAAACRLQADAPDALMLVLPFDHVIPDADAFRAAITAAAPADRAERLVTCGSSRPAPKPATAIWRSVTRPIREPAGRSRCRAPSRSRTPRTRSACSNPEDIWNAGIFLFSVEAIIAAFKTHALDLIDGVQTAVARQGRISAWLRAAHWAALLDISIDYAVLKRPTTSP